MARTKKKLRRRIGTAFYWLFMLLWAALLIGAAYYGFQVVWKYASDYEASRSSHVIEKYIKDLNDNLWDDEIAAKVSAMPHEVQTDEEVAVKVRELLSSGITYKRQSSGGEDKLSYSLYCNGNHKFGSVTLAKDKSGGAHGPLAPWQQTVVDTMRKFGIPIETDMYPWKVESEEFDFDALYTTMETVVPKMYTVTLNGTPLGEEYIIATDILYDVLRDYYQKFPNLPTKVRYRFEHCIGELVPAVTDEYGNAVTVDPNADDSQFIVPCPDEMIERLSEFSTAFLDRYLYFTSGVSNPLLAYEKLSGYIIPGSEFDTQLKDMMDGLSYGHTSSYHMDSAVLNNALSLGDGYYMCDVSADYTVFYPGRGEESGTSNMRIIVLDRDGDIRLISQELY